MKDFDFKAFENNGFIPIEDSSKRIKVIYNGEEFKVDFMTNIVHKITDDLIIAIGKTSIDSECELFINRDLIHYVEKSILCHLEHFIQV